MKTRYITYESIEACFNLLNAENKEDFLKSYRLATHSNGGDFAWETDEKYILKLNKKNKREIEKQKMKEERKKNRIKLHWYTDGKKNVKVAECPAGYHPGKVGKFRNMYGDCFR